MIKSDKEKYTDILKESLSYLENRGYENIKADTEGYETPKSFSKVGSDVNITPDIVAEKEGQRHYFELSLKSEEPNKKENFNGAIELRFYEYLNVAVTYWIDSENNELLKSIISDFCQMGENKRTKPKESIKLEIDR